MRRTTAKKPAGKDPFPITTGHSRARRDYRDLLDFMWVDEYLHMLALMAEADDLKRSISKTESAGSAKAELLTKAKEYHAEYERERQLILTRFFEKWRGFNSPFSRLAARGEISCTHHHSVLLPPKLDWSDVEGAINSMSASHERLTEADRQKALSHMRGRLNEVETELDAKYPKHVRNDEKAALVKLWISVQKQVCEPCTLFASPLHLAGMPDQVAHKKLGIAAYVNTDAQYTPRMD